MPTFEQNYLLESFVPGKGKHTVWQLKAL